MERDLLIYIHYFASILCERHLLWKQYDECSDSHEKTELLQVWKELSKEIASLYLKFEEFVKMTKWSEGLRQKLQVLKAFLDIAFRFIKADTGTICRRHLTLDCNFCTEFSSDERIEIDDNTLLRRNHVSGLHEAFDAFMRIIADFCCSQKITEIQDSLLGNIYSFKNFAVLETPCDISYFLNAVQPLKLFMKEKQFSKFITVLLEDMPERNGVSLLSDLRVLEETILYFLTEIIREDEHNLIKIPFDIEDQNAMKQYIYQGIGTDRDCQIRKISHVRALDNFETGVTYEVGGTSFQSIDEARAFLLQRKEKPTVEVEEPVFFTQAVSNTENVTHNVIKRETFSSSTGRRQKVPWTAEEVQHLENGLKIYGPGRWTDILKDNRFSFHEKRSGVDLKDKARNVRISRETRNEPLGAFACISSKNAKRSNSIN